MEARAPAALDKGDPALQTPPAMERNAGIPELRLIGAPTDRHSSFLRGAALAPPLIRTALRSDHSNMTAESGVELGADILLGDRGDLPLAEADGDDALIAAAVAEAAADGAVPLVLGGDHSVTVPVLEALAAAHGAIEILHFDAHADLYDDFEGNPRSHASPFARIMERGLARRLVQVGIRTLNRHCRDQAERFGVEIVEMRHFAPDAVPQPEGPLYVSLDLDAFDPAFAPGVSHHEPGGLSPRDVLAVLDRVRAPIVGADVVEYNPARDVNGVTAVLAAKLIKEVAALCHRNNR
ncbi:MAG TPA: agmatinase family protein [Allosphingosinicella sp.]